MEETIQPADLRAAAFGRQRAAVTSFFALGGFLFAGWAVRIPAIDQQIGATPGALGLALLCLSGAAVATMLVTGELCRRLGSREVTIASAALLAISIALPPLANSALTLGALLLVFGIAFGAIDVAVNSVAVELIAAIRRPIMPSFHAANSIGSLAGAGLGGLLAPLLSPAQHMLLIVPFGLLATAVGARVLMSDPLPEPAALDGGFHRVLHRLVRVRQVDHCQRADGQAARAGRTQRDGARRRSGPQAPVQ